jgi:anti-sigma factor RsiW
MGRVIRFRGGQHREVQDLLPWRLTGALEADEEARVDAHLSVCAECRADLELQRRLKAEIVQAPLDVEHGWSQMLKRLDAEDRPAPAPRRKPFRSPRPGWLSGGAPAIGLGWSAQALWGGAALATAAAVAGLVWTPALQPAAYHVLGAKTAANPGNVVVIFRPDTPEQRLRAVLKASHARLVDGPTAADGYVLWVPLPERAAALAALRKRPEVTLAEPIDPGEGK